MHTFRFRRWLRRSWPSLSAGLAAGCAAAAAVPGPPSARTDCMDAPSHLGQAFAELPDAAVEALAGTYELVLVATSPAERGRSARGRLTLWPTDTLQRYYTRALGVGEYRRWGDKPLYGSADIELARVGASTEGELRSADPEWPGVIVHRSGDVWLGFAAVLDGSTTALRITDVTSDSLWGTWEASYGYIVRVRDGREVPNPAGYFCAFRVVP